MTKTNNKLTSKQHQNVVNAQRLADSTDERVSGAGQKWLNHIYETLPHKADAIDAAIEATEGTGNASHWEPFKAQLDYLEERFYSTTSVSHNAVFYIRRHEEELPDEKVTGHAILATINSKFGYIHPAISEEWFALTPTSVAREYIPNGKKIVWRHHAPYANTWVPPRVNPAKQKASLPKDRPALWQEYLDRLMPAENTCWWYNSDSEKVTVPQQEYFEAWLAQRVRKPDEDNTVAVVLRGAFGTGKGFWMDVIANRLVGINNYKPVSTKDWKGDFNGDMFQSVIIHLEETKDTRQNTGEMLKKLITQDRQRSNEKNMPQRHVQRHFSVVISSNHKVPVTIEKGDRRYFVPVWSKHKIDDPEGEMGKHETNQFFGRLANWLENEGGYQQIRNWLQTIDLKSYPFRMAPDTHDKREISTEETFQESQQSQIVMELMAMSYKKHVYTASEVATHYRISSTDATMVLKLAGYGKKVGRLGGSKTLNLWVPLADANTDDLASHGYTLWRGNGGFEIELPEETPPVAPTTEVIRTNRSASSNQSGAMVTT